MACVPCKDSDQPGHLPSLIRVFAVRMKKCWVLSYPWSTGCTCHLVGFVMLRLTWYCQAVVNINSPFRINIWAPSSEFVSSSIPSWQTLTAHAQPFRGARDLAFCLKVALDSLLVWASSEGSGETARMRRLAWTFAAHIGYKYQIRLTRSILQTARQNQVLITIIHGNEKNLMFISSWSIQRELTPLF